MKNAAKVIAAALVLVIGFFVIGHNSAHKKRATAQPTSQVTGVAPQSAAAGTSVPPAATTAPVVATAPSVTLPPVDTTLYNPDAATVAKNWATAEWINDSNKDSSYLGFVSRTAAYETPAYAAAVKAKYSQAEADGNWSQFVSSGCYNAIPDLKVFYPTDMQKPHSQYKNTRSSQYVYVTGSINTHCARSGFFQPVYRTTELLHLSFHGDGWLVDSATAVAN